MVTGGEKEAQKGKTGQRIKRYKLLCIKLATEMATHSSILAWEIPWTENPGGRQSMGLQRVGHG